MAKQRRQAEEQERLAALKARSTEKSVFLNGWPLDAPHMRHTVTFDGSYPDRVLSGEQDGDVSLMLTNGGETHSLHKLEDDPARSVRGFR